MLGGDSHKKKKKHSDDYYYRGDILIYCNNLLIHKNRLITVFFNCASSFLCQSMMVQAHLPTRKSTSLQTAPHLCLPHHLPTQQIQRWASCRPSPLPWPQVRTPTLTYTKNPPTPPSPHTPPRTASVRAAVAVEAKGVTPSLTPVLCLPHHLPPRSTPPLPQSRLCSTVELPKRSL